MDPDRSPKERFEAIVHGRVQGVGFRVHAARTARDLGLVGWVANRGDGAVEVMAEGARRSLDALEEALREGPRGAAVQRVEMRRGPSRGGLSGFEVRHGAHPGD
jgi:acylphosphatase